MADIRDSKIIDLDGLKAFGSLVERNIPVYTMEEYKAKKSEIPIGTFFVVSDDSPQASSMEEAQVTSEDIDDVINGTTSDDDSLDDMFS